jgi:hypothetical protein
VVDQRMIRNEQRLTKCVAWAALLHSVVCCVADATLQKVRDVQQYRSHGLS